MLAKFIPVPLITQVNSQLLQLCGCIALGVVIWLGYFLIDVAWGNLQDFGRGRSCLNERIRRLVLLWSHPLRLTRMWVAQILSVRDLTLAWSEHGFCGFLFRSIAFQQVRIQKFIFSCYRDQVATRWFVLLLWFSALLRPNRRHITYHLLQLRVHTTVAVLVILIKLEWLGLGLLKVQLRNVWLYACCLLLLLFLVSCQEDG